MELPGARAFAVARACGGHYPVGRSAGDRGGRVDEAASVRVLFEELDVLVLAADADELFDLRGQGATARNGIAPASREEGEMVVAAVDLLARRIEDIAARLERT